jgi:hypothetical protein
VYCADATVTFAKQAHSKAPPKRTLPKIMILISSYLPIAEPRFSVKIPVAYDYWPCQQLEPGVDSFRRLFRLLEHVLQSKLDQARIHRHGRNLAKGRRLRDVHTCGVLRNHFSDAGAGIILKGLGISGLYSEISGGIKPSRLGILTLTSVCASITSFSWIMSFL